MRIIPVIDLKQGLVVRGVGGRREEYRPIESALCPTAEPEAVARALIDRFALSELYLADLDAVAGMEPAWDVYARLLSTGVTLWVDAGIGDRRRAEKPAKFAAGTARIERIIAGLESLERLEALAELTEEIGPDRVVFSLDLKQGRPLSDKLEQAVESRDAEEIAARAVRMGIRRMIVLDLAYVGSGAGNGCLELCRRLKRRFPTLELITGGGVRGLSDLEELARSGCDGALVASALHDGRLTAEDVARFPCPAG